MGSLDFAGGIGTCNSLWYFQREQEISEILELCCSDEPHH
jgi:hypothetical protein